VDVSLFQKVNQKLLHPNDRTLQNIPLKIYLPAAAPDDSQHNPQPGHLRVVQGLVPPITGSRQPQTLGTALNTLIPSLFPSRRSPLLAFPFHHGAIVPLSTVLAELAEWASYADGFLHVAIAMMG
jgi:autophagy-related protein 5